MEKGVTNNRENNIIPYLPIGSAAGKNYTQVSTITLPRAKLNTGRLSVPYRHLLSRRSHAMKSGIQF